MGGFLCCPSEILELTYLRHLTQQVEFGSSSLWNLIFSTCVLQEQGIYYTLCLGEPCPTASVEGLSSRIPILADLWKSPVLFLAQLLCSAVMNNFPVHSLVSGGLSGFHAGMKMKAFSAVTLHKSCKLLRAKV